MDSRVEFNIGWDFAAYGLTLPHQASDGLREGYTAGLDKFKRPIGEADRYVRKWLQLRSNAAKRNRIFEDDVTPDWIREIDVKVCPVTLRDLTHAAMCDTDWSVDRIVNDGSYARDNLAVMSTLANRAKGNKDFCAIYELAHQTEEVDGLRGEDWYRLATMVLGTFEMAGLVGHGRYVMPFSPRIPKHMYLSLYQSMQDLILTHVFWRREQDATTKSLLALVEKHGGQPAFKRLEKRMRKVATSPATANYVMLDRSTFEKFCAMMHELTGTSRQTSDSAETSNDSLTREMLLFRDVISIRTRGYAV